MTSKSCAITSLGCAGVVLLLVLAPFALLGQGNLAAAVLCVGAGGFGLVWYRIAVSRYRKGGLR